jgi:TRAP-type C4-dicarboxylate transport system substrate-binding protein
MHSAIARLRTGAIAAVAAVSAAALTSALPAAAQEKTVNLKLSHFLPPTFILFRPNSGGGLTEWMESIEKASKGSIKFTVYPSQQLGKAADHYDMAKNGIADITMTTPGYSPGRFPIISIAEVPMLLPDARQGSAAFWAWYRKVSDNEMGDVKVLNAYVMEPMLLHTRKPVVKPEDLQGMKLRPTHGTLGKFFTALGASTSQVPVTEARDLMEKGIVDGLTLQWGSTVAFGIAKSVSHHLDLKMATGAVTTIMNKRAYEALSPEQKKVIDDHATPYWAQRITTPWSMWDIAGRDEIAAMPGHTIHRVTPEQVAAWKKAAEPILAGWQDDVKKRFPQLDPAKMLADLRQRIDGAEGFTWQVYD